MKRPLLVTDPGLASLPMVEQAVASCNRAGLACAVFSNIKGNPTGANVEDGVTAFRQGRHDGVIAFGGGSGLDAGKAIALGAGQTRESGRASCRARVGQYVKITLVAAP